MSDAIYHQCPQCGHHHTMKELQNNKQRCWVCGVKYSLPAWKCISADGGEL